MSKSKQKGIRLTITVDPDFYPVLQGLPTIVGLTRDELIVEAVRNQYRNEISRLAGLAKKATEDEEESDGLPLHPHLVALPA